MSVGERIGELAKEKGVSLRQLALSVEIPYNTLYSCVSRKSDRISVITVYKIAKSLDVPITYFF